MGEMTKKKLLLGMIASVLAACPTYGQVKLAVGAQGQIGPNLSLGPSVEISAAIKRITFLSRDTLSLENHIALGNGWANESISTGTLWVASKLGLTSGYENTRYQVTLAKKHADYVLGGVTVKVGSDTQLTFAYQQEFHNGVRNGLETSHFRGGVFEVDTTLGCSNHGCLHFGLVNELGRILEQGNPACDGSLGPVTCARNTAVSGNVQLRLMYSFGKH